MDEVVHDFAAETKPGVTYNFATWIELDDADGYWEYMLHEFKWNTFDYPTVPEKCPTVVHAEQLPTRATTEVPYHTLYGVAPVKSASKR